MDRSSATSRLSVRQARPAAAVRDPAGLVRASHRGVWPAARSRDGRFLAAACLVVVLARVSTLWLPLRADEGGYLLLARQWRSGGEFVYGDYFLDRPPLLLLLFRLAALGGWDGWIRVVAVPFSVALVVSAWRAGTWVGGVRGARWSTAVAAALVVSPAVAADSADGELFSTVLSMVAVACALEAWGAPGARRAGAAAVAAGVVAAAAPLVKQNALEGTLVLGVVVVTGLWTSGPCRHRAVLLATAGGAGGALTALALGLWMWAAGVDPAVAWHDVVTFRRDALDVIWSGRQRATVVRGAQLVALATVSGLVGVLATWVSFVRGGGPRRSPVVLATTVLVPYGLVSIAAGGSFWPSYLLQLVPVVVLVVGALCGSEGRTGTRARGWSRLVCVVAVVAWAAELVLYAATAGVWFQQRTGEWLSASAVPGDTAVVLYGSPNVLETADLASPYPYLWSVPVRTLDPDLDRLRTTLSGDDAPAWVVEMNPLDSWGIDDGARLRSLVSERYQVLAEVCGNRIHLRNDLDREPAPPVRC